MWYIDYNYIFSGPTSLNKYLKHIKLLKVLSLSKYYRFSIIIIMIVCTVLYRNGVYITLQTIYQ